ncbi:MULTISPECIES: 3-isopropylmalate dehydratase small subunit [Limnochorda]|uniref:3-isopropylmalate dehydratase small subunit n=1 Tax=Limnochorda TaxID=1676651 RepID=UPI0017BFB8EF|nr:3-isopropylmalate dehydratase small subunit [Limnochorda pilosa]MBO2485415.1 3-isopropylmalate dehydratase small subunit [Bacillota bacterium]MBO2518990.1 3-isopropylmalate dehydratase small subunit [Bacillota bacterium]NMA70824.1 3-isopropylmalate dehydratase small subunit [Bacillota bacterium]
MEPFRVHRGLAVPLDRINVDTDQIVPKQFLKRVERTGFGQFLFYDWRYDEQGQPRPDFVLNLPRYQGATILITGANFGCGSSREHAPWALKEYGFRAILAPSFADIFYNNCLNNGLLPVRLEAEVVGELMRRATEEEGYYVTVDLEACQVRDDHGLVQPFELDAFRRRMLLEGLDPIDITLEHEAAIRAYEAAHPGW